MAEIQQQQTTHSRRRPHAPVRIDMTPMVDLAFLLLTFFVLTSELAKQNAITVAFPKDGPTTKVNGLTVLLGKDPEKIFWYRGEFGPSVHLNVVQAGKDGLFDVLKQENPAYAPVAVIDRQHNLGLINDDAWKKQRAEYLGSESIPHVVVKWDESASYESVVNTIDDLNRSRNPKYAVVPMTKEEKALLEKR